MLRRPGRDLGEAIRVGNLAFHPGSGSVSVEEVPLTVPRRKLALLESPIRRNGRVVTRATLEDELWGFADEVESNTLESHVSRLRKRLMETGATVRIHTVRGVGYMLGPGDA